MGRVAKVILGHVREYIDIVDYSSDPVELLTDVVVNDLHSHIIDKKLC